MTPNEIIDYLRDHPEVAQSVARFIERADEKADEYRETHWGDEGDDPDAVSACPDPSAGLVKLGDLREIVYYTRKKGETAGEYVHTFSPPHPWLCYGPDGTGKQGLIVVRGPSRFDVAPHGIIG